MACLYQKERLLEKNDTNPLRGILIAMVIMCHFYMFFVSRFSYPTLRVDNVWGFTSVAGFLFLSGYGMFLSLCRTDKTYLQYLRKSFFKLFVPFLFFMVVDLISDLIYINRPMGAILLDDFLAFFSPVRYWYLKYLLIEYFLLISLYYFSKKNKAVVSLVLLIVHIIYVLIAWKLHFKTYLFVSILLFPIGIIYAAYFKHLNDISTRTKVLALIVLLILYCGAEFTIKHHIIIAYKIWLSILFPFIAIIVVSMINIRTKVLNWMGSNSLMLYLSHIAILYPAARVWALNEYLLWVYTIVFTAIVCAIYLKVEPWMKRVMK